ncbi:MAG: hypothetical protein WC856_15130 [Methylococcaceae bacterium]
MISAKLRKDTLRAAEHLLPLWLPDGKIVGDEFVACNPNRDDGSPGSFKISLITGKWSDFALDGEDSKGSDIVSYYMYIHRELNVKEAEKALRSDLEGVPERIVAEKATSTKVLRKLKLKPVSAQLPDDVGFPEFIRDCEPVVDSWKYHDPSGKVVFYVVKVINEDGRKEVIPVTLDHNGVVSCGLPGFPEGTPLYNSHLLKPDVSVVFGEGEKVVDHLQKVYPDRVAMTSQGGSSALFKSNLQPLWKASEITVFPDADEPGMKYAMQLGIIAQLKGIPVSILDVEAMGWVDGEDVADFPDLDVSAYSEHILPFSEWFAEKSDKVRGDAVVSVLASIPALEYEMLRKTAYAQFKIRTGVLDREVAKARPPVEGMKKEVEPDLTPEEKAERRSELWPDIKHIAELPNILETVVDVCHQVLNVVGERALIKLLYLGVVSRVLKAIGDCPVSIFCKGSSSGGKSYVMGVVLSLFRENETWLRFGSMSQKAMIYDQDTDYRRKVLFFPEINQFMQDKDADLTMMVKTILSEHELNHRVVETNPITGEKRTINIHKEGPIGLFAGTTRDFTDPEIETRVLSAYVNESQDQTKAILAESALSKANPISVSDSTVLRVLDTWHKFDEWIEMHPTHMVAIPYFLSVIEALEHMPVRFRRDIPHGLSGLIKASALMHCAAREVSEEEYVIATLDDYENAREAIEVCLSLAANPGETPACTMVLNWVIKKVQALTPTDKGILKAASRDIAQDLGLHQSTVTRHINTLIKSNQLKNMETNKGKPYRLLLGPEIAQNTDGILPTKEQVLEKWKSD